MFNCVGCSERVFSSAEGWLIRPIEPRIVCAACFHKAWALCRECLLAVPANEVEEGACKECR